MLSELRLSSPGWRWNANIECWECGGNWMGWDTHLETWICSGGTRMELRSNSLDLDGCETWNGWMWDANIIPGCNMNWRILDMDGCETVHGGGHGCRWGRTWMDVRHIMIPGWVSDWTWMDKRCSFRDLHEGETWPGWRWDAYIETCIEMSCDLDGCETLISSQVSIISTHLNPGDKSLLSKFQNSISVSPSTHINAIQVSSLSKSYLTYIWVLVSTLYTYHLIFLMVPRLSSLLHPFHVSPAS